MFMEQIAADTKAPRRPSPAIRLLVGFGFLMIVAPVTILFWAMLAAVIVAQLAVVHVWRAARLLRDAVVHAGDLIMPEPVGRRS